MIKGMIMNTNQTPLLALLLGLVLIPAIISLAPHTGKAKDKNSEMAEAQETAVVDAYTDRIHQPPPTPYLPAKNAVLIPPSVPTRMRIAIFSKPDYQSLANRIFVLLGDLNRRVLEQRIGLKLSLVNISRSLDTPPIKNVIFYRPKFLRAALLLAETIPGEQIIRPMPTRKLKKSAADVEVWVSKEAPNR